MEQMTNGKKLQDNKSWQKQMGSGTKQLVIPFLLLLGLIRDVYKTNFFEIVVKMTLKLQMFTALIIHCFSVMKQYSYYYGLSVPSD